MKLKAFWAALVAVSLSGLFWHEAAWARDEEQQVRLACDLQRDGRLANCVVLSRLDTTGPEFEPMALETARHGRVWPQQLEAPPERIHFPVLFLQEADPGADETRLVVRARADDQRAVVPTLPPGDHGRAWNGLLCITSRDAPPRCEADRHPTREGLLGGKLVYFEPVTTLSGVTLDLPDSLPVLPAEARTTWENVGSADYPIYLSEASQSDDAHLFWSARLLRPKPGWVGNYDLWEYDCRNHRERILYSINVSEDGIRSLDAGTRDWRRTRGREGERRFCRPAAR